MRDNRFRGKSAIDGKWVYGYYRVIGKDKTVIYTVDDNEIPIIAGTEGQFTGLLDAKGKEIYEGDIVQEYGGGKRKATIEWIKIDSCFAVQTGEPEIHTISRHIKEHGNIEVIGNVYEDIKQGGN